MGNILVESKKNHMATTFEFVVSVPKSEGVRVTWILESAHELVSDLENELSKFSQESPVWALNRAELLEELDAPDSVITLLELSRKISVMTNDAFRPLLGAIYWDIKRKKMWRANNEGEIDFGAIGKGYALDRVKALLDQEGLTDFFLNAGGSSFQIQGFADQGFPWQWGWAWEKSTQGIPFIHNLGTAIAVGVSGTSEKGAHIRGGAENQVIRSAMAIHKSAAVSISILVLLTACGGKKDEITVQLSSGGESAVESLTSANALCDLPFFQVFARDNQGGFQRIPILGQISPSAFESLPNGAEAMPPVQVQIGVPEDSVVKFGIVGAFFSDCAGGATASTYFLSGITPPIAVHGPTAVFINAKIAKSAFQIDQGNLGELEGHFAKIAAVLPSCPYFDRFEMRDIVGNFNFHSNKVTHAAIAEIGPLPSGRNYYAKWECIDASGVSVSPGPVERVFATPPPNNTLTVVF